METLTQDELWALIIQGQGKPLRTVRNVPFSYSISVTRTGTYGGELFIHSDSETVWSSKSITRSTAYAAYRIACDIEAQGGTVKGPKQLKVFGRQFLYPILLDAGILRKEGKCPQIEN